MTPHGDEMDDDFAFNKRMMAMLGAAVLLLMATCFGLGVLYAEYGRGQAKARTAAPAPEGIRSIKGGTK